MFVLSRQGYVAFRAIAMLVAVALVLWAVGFHSAKAANLTGVSDTLSDSDTGGVASDHTIRFTVPAGSNGIDATSETIVVTFDAGFNLTSLTTADFDMTVGGVDQTLAAAPSGATWGVGVSGQNVTFTTDTGTVTAGQEVIVYVGQVGPNAAGTENQIVSPVGAGSYNIDIDLASGQDTARTEVAIVDNVDVTASVDTNFVFTVNGFSVSGVAVNGTSTNGTSTATLLGFGELGVGTVHTLAQNLTVETNATQGYIVTVEQDQDLTSGAGDTINGFVDGNYQNTPIAWASPNGTLAFGPDGWGHWGLTSGDDLNGREFLNCAASSTYGCWVAASTTPRQIMEHDGPADGATDLIGSTTVGYQIEISALQEAADDYATTLTYIATPTF